MSSHERRSPDFFQYTKSFYSTTCPSCGELKCSGHWLCIRCAAAENPFASWLFRQTLKIYEIAAETYIRGARINRVRLERELEEKSEED